MLIGTLPTPSVACVVVILRKVLYESQNEFHPPVWSTAEGDNKGQRHDKSQHYQRQDHIRIEELLRHDIRV